MSLDGTAAYRRLDGDDDTRPAPGRGAGLAWMASVADEDVSLVSVEIDPDRAVAAQRVFEDRSDVTVLHGEAAALFARGPFDLLVQDGGWGSGKMGGEKVDPTEVLTEGGVMTISRRSE